MITYLINQALHDNLVIINVNISNMLRSILAASKIHTYKSYYKKL